MHCSHSRRWPCVGRIQRTASHWNRSTFWFCSRGGCSTPRPAACARGGLRVPQQLVSGQELHSSRSKRGACEGQLSCETPYHLWPSLLAAGATFVGIRIALRAIALRGAHMQAPPCTYSNLLGWSLPSVDGHTRVSTLGLPNNHFSELCPPMVALGRMRHIGVYRDIWSFFFLFV